MLSRTGDSLFWMSRYLERAEHAARVVNVNAGLSLDSGAVTSERRWTQVFRSLGNRIPPAAENDAAALLHALTLDHTCRTSIVSCIVAARENARQVREQISSEMWEELNRLYLEVRRADTGEGTEDRLTGYLQAVLEGAHLFQGLTDSTMNHGEGWQFIQVGRSIERAQAVAALLDAHYQEYLGSAEWQAESGDYPEWIGLLKSCTAFEAYCKVYTADLTPDRIAEFLLLNAEFPHSVRFAAEWLYTCLRAIQERASGTKANRLDRLAGRLRAGLSFAQIDEVIAGGLHGYLAGIKTQCAQIHQAVYQVYISYPIEAALEA